MKYLPFIRIVCTMCAILLLFGASAARAGSEAPQYNRDIQPILAENCFQCHGPDEAARKAGMRLDVPESARAILTPGDGGVSELVRRILAGDPDDRMPPAEVNKHLTAGQKTLLQQWVAAGAEYEEHWAFIPPKRPAVPMLEDAAWATSPIDHFILRGIRKADLKPSPPADRATLIRRVYLDLTGLPPTPAEIAAFEKDPGPDAYEMIVDRLLRSDRYGEHQAQSWLEVARYADTDGYQNDRLRYMHVWRDWLIGALNQNIPYDQFIIDQMAGDMLPDATLRQQIATGFNRNHRINSENGAIPEEWLVENVVDRVDTLGTAFLGLTVSCARCHDHKYDPISQREYYQLYAQFNNVPEWGLGPNDGNSPPYIKVPESWPNIPPEKNKLIEPDPYRLVLRKATALRPEPGKPDTAMVMQEMPEPRPTYRLNRGVYNEPDKSERLEPGVPGVLLGPGEEAPADRLELARWLVRPDHPLTSRVAVNRFWQHLFGAGIVKTQENFGLQGSYPSHPELLDWLATEFIRLDWDVKAFLKTLVMSATYRQSSAVSPDALSADPENRLLSHAPRLRLTGQQLRDQALYVSGLLVNEIGGVPTKPYMPPGIWDMANVDYEQGEGEDLYRRSIYTYWRRTTPPPMMTGFNSPNRDTCIVRAEKTNSPLHALTLMNNVTFVEAARKLAERTLLARPTPRAQIAAAFRRVTGRNAEKDELNALRALYSEMVAKYEAEQAAAQALLETGESPRHPDLAPARLAAMTTVASAILNLDEVIMRN